MAMMGVKIGVFEPAESISGISFTSKCLHKDISGATMSGGGAPGVFLRIFVLLLYGHDMIGVKIGIFEPAESIPDVYFTSNCLYKGISGATMSDGCTPYAPRSRSSQSLILYSQLPPSPLACRGTQCTCKVRVLWARIAKT